jgi:integrase
VKKLLGVTRSSDERRGMTGEDRAVLYTVALASGLRREELASLTPASFRLDASPPVVVTPASYCKNGEEAVQPLPGHVADGLRGWLRGKPIERPVFDLPQSTAEMVRADARAAGVDPDGLDMHALRHTYITNLARSNTPIAITQKLARHSDPKLTLGVYTHLDLEDGRAAVEASVPYVVPYKGGGEGREESGPGGMKKAPESTEACPNTGEEKALDAAGDLSRPMSKVPPVGLEPTTR